MLYHFSEDPGIERFDPRPSPASPELGPVVWAIDATRAPHYYFPRDCPRVIYWKADTTKEEYIAAFFAFTSADKIIAVESGWLERIRSARLYKYSFAEESFRLTDGSAGYWVSQRPVVPLKVEPAGDLLQGLARERLELRLTPSLVPLRDAVIASSLDFSIIRFRNAIGAKP